MGSPNRNLKSILLSSLVAKNKKKSTLINSKHMIRKGKREQMENMIMNLQKCGNYWMKMKKIG